MIHLITALRSEAQPLIEHFNLTETATHPAQRIYENDNIRLGISGVGKVNVAAMIGYLAALNPAQPVAWINIGIAGHNSLPLGSQVLIDRIIDRDSGSVDYLHLGKKLPYQSLALTTVSIPETNYPGDTLFDMEGSGFFVAAHQFSSLELLSVIKIVSDNRDEKLANITKAAITNHIANSIPMLDHLIEWHRSQISDHLSPLSSVTSPWLDKEWTDRWRVTFAQKKRLQVLTARLALLECSLSPQQVLGECTSAKDAIERMQQCLAKTPLRLSEST